MTKVWSYYYQRYGQEYYKLYKIVENGQNWTEIFKKFQKNCKIVSTWFIYVLFWQPVYSCFVRHLQTKLLCIKILSSLDRVATATEVSHSKQLQVNLWIRTRHIMKEKCCFYCNSKENLETCSKCEEVYFCNQDHASIHSL